MRIYRVKNNYGHTSNFVQNIREAEQAARAMMLKMINEDDFENEDEVWIEVLDLKDDIVDIVETVEKWKVTDEGFQRCEEKGMRIEKAIEVLKERVSINEPMIDESDFGQFINQEQEALKVAIREMEKQIAEEVGGKG